MEFILLFYNEPKFPKILAMATWILLSTARHQCGLQKPSAYESIGPSAGSAGRDLHPIAERSTLPSTSECRDGSSQWSNFTSGSTCRNHIRSCQRQVRQNTRNHSPFAVKPLHLILPINQSINRNSGLLRRTNIAATTQPLIIHNPILQYPWLLILS